MGNSIKIKNGFTPLENQHRKVVVTHDKNSEGGDQSYHRNTLLKGFTLIELLVVLAIIGVILGVGITSYTRARLLSRDAKRKGDIAQIRLALELYFQDMKTYPSSPCEGTPPLPNEAGWTALSDGTTGLTATINGLGPWVANMPTDPLNISAQEYVYKYCSDSVISYKISYKTEADGQVTLIERP